MDTECQEEPRLHVIECGGEGPDRGEGQAACGGGRAGGGSGCRGEGGSGLSPAGGSDGTLERARGVGGELARGSGLGVGGGSPAPTTSRGCTSREEGRSVTALQASDAIFWNSLVRH